ncbi:MAG: hypothetical protein ABIK07_03845 [Planctomycetota bacterium]
MNEDETIIPNHGLTHEQIAIQAFAIWKQENEPDCRDKLHWHMAIEYLLVVKMKQLETQMRPQSLNDVWDQLRILRHGVRVSADSEIKMALSDRPDRGRDQDEDNKMLKPVSTAMFRALSIGDPLLAITVFKDAYEEIIDYEKTEELETHKGAITFDVASTYLRAWDFYAAMHYYELAQDETRKTDQDDTFSIFRFDLFEKNFWDSFDYGTTAHTNDAYQALWGIAYDKVEAKKDYGNLTSDSRLAYIIACSLRLRLQHLEAHSHWDGSNALRLGYWTLAADLARLLEVEANHRQALEPDGSRPSRKTLVDCLEKGFKNTAYGNLSREMVSVIYPNFRRKHPKNGAPPILTPEDYYEAAFNPLLLRIKDTTKNRADRLAHSLYLLGFTRNQVAHRIDSSTKLFKQLDDAKYLVDLFISLCRTDEWKAI